MFERGRLFVRRGRLPVGAVAVGMLAVSLGVGSLVSCGWSADQPVDAVTRTQATSLPLTASPPRSDAPVRPAPTPIAAQPSPEPLVSLATADAARRTGAGPDRVRVVQVDAREWPDRSLGCPRPGMGYAQAITPGFLIVVEVEGQRFEYHTDHARAVLCSPP